MNCALRKPNFKFVVLFLFVHAQICLPQTSCRMQKRNADSAGEALKGKSSSPIVIQQLQRRHLPRTEMQQKHPTNQSQSIKSKTNVDEWDRNEINIQDIDNTLETEGKNDNQGECSNCGDDSSTSTSHIKWTMPLLKAGEKKYYLGTFFKANWYRASQFCRYHGMHLASIANQEENNHLEKYVTDFGYGFEHFWTSGNDLAEEGSFFWMSTGKPISFTNWNAGEPNNFKYENGEEEHCLELWNRDGKGLKWNDSPCSFETYFICEAS